MHGTRCRMAFPPSNELAFLIGKEVTRVAFQTSGVRIIWWEGGEIDAMCNFEHCDQRGIRHRLGDVFVDPPSMLHRLIQRKVSSVKANGSYLTLTFDDGQELIFDGTGVGENGLIKLGNELTDGYIVF